VALQTRMELLKMKNPVSGVLVGSVYFLIYMILAGLSGLRVGLVAPPVQRLKNFEAI